VEASVWASVGASVRASVEASVGAINADNYCNYTDFGWTAWIDFFCEENFTKDNPIWVKFNIWKHFLGAGVFETYSFQNICFVVKSPTKIIKNENGALHNPTGPAIEFPDGYCQYYINGRNLPAWIWEQRDAITKERFLQEKNAEIRGGMYAVLGQKKVFDLIGASEISRKFANNETYVLYRTNEKIGDKYWQWVGVKCPSTATEYLLGVPDTVTCPIEAVAATWGISANEYIINQHT
jgi:sarcosine oxidase delta subunit